MAEAQKGIQATLFDYFQDTEYFTLQEAEEHVLDHQKREVNVPSIRARIYEGIEKGLFERVGKGLYTVIRTDEQGRENRCLLINGDGRDLSFIPSNSVDNNRSPLSPYRQSQRRQPKLGRLWLVPVYGAGLQRKASCAQAWSLPR